MSAAGSLNTKNPTIKRIHREAIELSSNPSSDFTATPQETNLFEWHFTLRGPPDSPYAGGIYHGRISLPPAYPLRPPAFRFLTPSGRFEVNREICLSISGHHEESWQPAWGIRTALVAMRSFMDTDAKGQLGGIDTGKETRMRYARDSKTWKCSECAKSNEEIMKELEEDCARLGADARKEDAVPEELKLGYKDELGKDKAASTAPTAATPKEKQADANDSAPLAPGNGSAVVAVGAEPVPNFPPSIEAATTVQQAQTAQIPPVALAGSQLQRQQQSDAHHWLDMAISGIALALMLMLVRKVVPYL